MSMCEYDRNILREIKVILIEKQEVQKEILKSLKLIIKALRKDEG
jgi:hypothetical protein